MHSQHPNLDELDGMFHEDDQSIPATILETVAVIAFVFGGCALWAIGIAKVILWAASR